jgi:hypothetical protein
MYYKAFQHGNEEGTYQSKHDPLKVQYKVGQTYAIDGDAPPELCKRGYHACTVPINCFHESYGYKYEYDALGIVELSGERVRNDLKTASSSMRIIRILTREEMSSLCTGVLLRDGSFYTENIDCKPAYTTQWWYKNARLHRDGDEPAIICSTGIDGPNDWHCNRLHRDSDSDSDSVCINTMWAKNGVLHRDGDKPAMVCDSTTMQWYWNGRLHREGDKPARICNGSMEWYVNGALHRGEDKPARICADGSMEWYMNGKFRR